MSNNFQSRTMPRVPLVVVQSPSHVWLFATSWTAAHQPSLSLTISWSLPKFMSIESVMPSSHLILSCPLPLLPSIFPSIRLFSSESTLHQVAKVLELQLQHQSFQWIFRIDFFCNWLVWSPCCPRDSQESSPAPQFESINSLEYLAGNKCHTTYENIDLCFYMNCWLCRRIESIHQPRQLWTDPLKLFLVVQQIQLRNLAMEVLCQASDCRPPQPSQKLEPTSVLLICQNVLFTLVLSEVSRAGVRRSQRERAPGLISLSAGAVRAASPYFQHLPCGRCSWYFPLICAWC